MIINNKKTYFGALEVREKILLGSKYLNITYCYFNLTIDFYYEMIVWSRMSEGDNNEG